MNDQTTSVTTDEELPEQAVDAATETESGSQDSVEGYQPEAFSDLAEGTVAADSPSAANLEVILDIPVVLSMEIGRTSISIEDLLQLARGSVVELDRMAGEPLDVLVNGTLVARGEVVVVNDKFGVRLSDVISPAERVGSLK